jgi:hypothetical protein
MLRWAFSWEEAAKRPWRTVISVVVAGGLLAGVYGYFRLGDQSVGWGLALGLSVGLLLGVSTWRSVRDPARVAELSRNQKEFRGVALRGAAARLALPFVALGIATAAGAASHSVDVFALTLGGGLAASLVLRRFLPR